MARRGRAELAIADTSVFIALERKRKMAGLRLNVSLSPWSPWASCAWASCRNRRTGTREASRTVSQAEALEPLPIDSSVARAWATLRLALRDQGRQMPLNDSWIAATAIAHHLPVVAQDADYDDVPGLQVIRV